MDYTAQLKQMVADRDRRIESLIAALAFYADSRRYDGPNQKPIGNDPYAPDDLVYRYDVTRDRGAVAFKALQNALQGKD